MRVNNNTLFFWLVTCVIFICASAPAQAYTKNDILQPLQDELEVYKAAQKETERQAALNLKELEEVKAFLESCRAEIIANVDRLNEEHATKLNIFDRSILTGYQLIINDTNQKIYLPDQGWVTVSDLLASRDRFRESLNLVKQEIEEGRYKFFIAGLGLIDRNSLEAMIAAKDKAIENLNQNVTNGSFSIYFPGLGDVTKAMLEQKMAYLEEIIQQTTESLKAGDYVFTLPYLGSITRNQMDNKIATLQQDIKILKEAYKKQEKEIKRTLMDWASQKGVQDSIAEINEQTVATKKQLAEKSYKHYLPTGWANIANLKAEVAKLTKEIETIRTQEQSDTYKVALQDGTWTTGSNLDKALVNSLISPEIRDMLTHARKDIKVTLQYEVEVRELQLAKLKNWLNIFNNHATSLQNSYQLQITQKKRLLKEYNTEQQLTLSIMQKKLNWLRKNRKLIP